MHAGAMLPLDDPAFTADRLDGIEAAVPDGDAGNGEGADEVAFHVQPEPLADHHADEAGDDRRHGQDLPVVFIDKEAELLAQVDPDLAHSSRMVDFADTVGFYCAFRHSAAPPRTS